MRPIMIVDDDDEDLDMIKEAFSAIAVENPLVCFNEAKKAFEYLQGNERPLLILCDVNMPVITGLDLQRMIHENEFIKKKSIPFYFLSTGRVEENKLKASRLGIRGFLKKPDSFNEMKRMLEYIVDYCGGLA